MNTTADKIAWAANLVEFIWLLEADHQPAIDGLMAWIDAPHTELTPDDCPAKLAEVLALVPVSILYYIPKTHPCPENN